MIPNLKEKQYLDENFVEIFKKYFSRKAVVYGTTEMTETFLERCADLDIVGIIDFDVNREMIFGLPILEMEDLLKKEIEILIILEKESETRKIYAKINEFCVQNNILLLNRFGRELYFVYGSFYKTRTRNQYFMQCEADLMEKIMNADVIYFELLDTLVSCKTLHYDDIELVRKRSNCLGEVRLNDLYVIRYKMKEIVQKCLMLNKKVYILDTIGLPEQEKNVSLTLLDLTDVNAIKTEEIDWENISREKFMYVGGKKAAIKKFESYSNGRYFRILSVFEMLSISSYREIVSEIDTLNERSMLGMFANRIFNNPFALFESFGKPTIVDLKDLGYTFIGPMMAQFVLWIIQKVEKGKFENILFSARDGYLIQKIYQMALLTLKKNELPRGIYFKTSRKLCINAGLEKASEIQGIAQQPIDGTPEEMLHNRFNLSMEDISKYNQEKYNTPVLYSLAHKKEILKAASECRKKYKTYIKQLNLREGRPYLFFDLCSCGTCQFYLNRILPIDITGLYLCFYRSNERMRRRWKDELNYFSFYENEYGYDIKSNVYRDYNFMETFMTSTETSVISIDSNGKMIYAEDDRTMEELEYIKEMQESIFDFCKEYYQNMYVEGYGVNNHFLDKLYGFKSDKYTNKKCEILDRLVLRDEWVMRTKKIEKI